MQPIRKQFEQETHSQSHDVCISGNFYNEKYVEWLEQRLEAGQVDTIVMRRDEIPVGSIRRLLHWARYGIEGKGKPYTDGDGKNDVVAVEKWTDKFG